MTLVTFIKIVSFFASLYVVWAIFNMQKLSPPKEVQEYSEIVRMPFRQIRQIYALNPERLKYQQVHVKYSCTGYNKTKDSYLLLNYADNALWTIGRYPFEREWNSQKIVAIEMTPLEAIKFKIAKKKHPNNSKTQELILKAMQGDINRLREKAQIEIDQAREITERVARCTNTVQKESDINKWAGYFK